MYILHVYIYINMMNTNTINTHGCHAPKRNPDVN